MKSAAGYSARVELELITGDRVLELSQIAPDKVTLREAVELCPTEALVVMRVDGNEHSWNVRLPNAAVPFDTEVAIESI